MRTKTNLPITVTIQKFKNNLKIINSKYDSKETNFDEITKLFLSKGIKYVQNNASSILHSNVVAASVLNAGSNSSFAVQNNR